MLNATIRSKLIGAFAALTALIAATALLGLWLNASVWERTERVGAHLAPHGVAALELQLAGSNAHRIFEEIMAGDDTEDIKQVWDLLQTSKWYATAILEGGQNAEGRFLPTGSAAVRGKMERVRELIEDFIAATRQRYDGRAGGGSVGSKIEQDFDRAYSVLLTGLDDISAAAAAGTGVQARILRDAGEAKFLLANAHLFLEEIIAGDRSQDAGAVRADLQRARQLIDALGATSAGARSAGLSTQAEAFIAFAAQRLEGTKGAGQVGSTIETQFDSIFNAFVTTAGEAEDLIAADVNAALAEALSYQSFSTIAMLAALVSGVMLAALLAFVIARSISARVKTLSAQMEALAHGQMETQVSFTGDRDEIGLMARALEVFKTAVIDRAALTRQRQAEREEHDQAALQVERSFQQDVSLIIEAASAGDFTRRVDTSTRTGLAQKIGEGVNRLVGTVDGAFKGIIEVISAMAKGDLTRRVDGEYKGSFLQLKTDANTMADKFRAMARRIAGVTREVQGATLEISSGVADLSARTEHQASSLEETSASMEELAATVRQNANHSEDANQAAAAARDAAESGGAIAIQAVAAMGRIESSSREITEITGLIQDIAFQTNLLALNAAVEAARAGEAGKGFAVVANEVRALAQRASQASKDIKALIVNSSAEVREGVGLVKQAGSALGDIAVSVKRVAGLVSEIAAATREQSAGIEQVSRAVAGMDQMTQQNAALVEETNAALHSARGQTEELSAAVSFFQTGDSAPEPRQPPANPVRQQIQNLSRRIVATRSPHAIAPAPDDWKEF